MPKRPAAPPADIEENTGSPTATPEPADALHVSLTELAPGKVLHRVHLSEYQADQFNPGPRGNARFSPIQDDEGKAIPTLYAAHDIVLCTDGDRLLGPRRLVPGGSSSSPPSGAKA